MKTGVHNRQSLLKEHCSKVFDLLGLPDEENIKALEDFLLNTALSDLDFDECIKSTISDNPTIFWTIKALTLHDFFGPIQVVCGKLPDKLNKSVLGQDLYYKLLSNPKLDLMQSRAPLRVRIDDDKTLIFTPKPKAMKPLAPELNKMFDRLVGGFVAGVMNDVLKSMEEMKLSAIENGPADVKHAKSTKIKR